jgi:hypothetical protein
MRYALWLLFLVPTAAHGQLTDAEKKATLAYVATLYDSNNGAYKVDAKAKPSLRATSGAVRTYAYLSEKAPNAGKNSEFLLSCYDAANGGFHEPGSQPDVAITSIALLAVGDLGLAEEKYPKAVDYLKANAKTFEDVRIGAAALEALKKKPDWLDAWIKIANAQLNNDGTAGKGDGQARDTASVAAMKLRLGYPLANKAKVSEVIRDAQAADGGWTKAGAKSSDLETTYRVMRALMLLKEKPADVGRLNAFLAKCRNPDGGYSVEPRNASTMSGAYYAAAISKWMEK